MVEKGVIPGVAGLETVNPQIRVAKLNVKISRDTSQCWTNSLKESQCVVFWLRRHKWTCHCRGYRCFGSSTQIRRSQSIDNVRHSTTRALLVTSQPMTKRHYFRDLKAHAAVADQHFLADLSHTSNNKRSRFAQRGYLTLGLSMASCTNMRSVLLRILMFSWTVLWLLGFRCGEAITHRGVNNLL